MRFVAVGVICCFYYRQQSAYEVSISAWSSDVCSSDLDVAGYAVARGPVGDERPVWFGGGRLARDLSLPRLREGWPDSPQTAQGAVDEWRAASKNPWQYRPVAPGREEHADRKSVV